MAKQLAKAKADYATAEAGRKAAISKVDKKARATKALKAKHDKTMAKMKKAYQKKLANLKVEKKAAMELAHKATETHKEGLLNALLMHENAAPVTPTVAPASCSTCANGASNVKMEQKTIVNIPHSDSSESESHKEE